MKRQHQHIARVLAACGLLMIGLVSCGDPEHERSENVEFSSYHSFVPTGAQSTVGVNISPGRSMPETLTIDSVEARPEGIIELEPYAPDQSRLDFRAVGPGEVTVRVNVEYVSKSFLGEGTTKREYNEVQFEIVEVERIELQDPCVTEQGEQLERILSEGRLQLNHHIDWPSRGAGTVGGRDHDSVWVRDATGRRVPAVVRFINTSGDLFAPMSILAPGEVTVESDKYNLSHTLRLRSPEDIDDIEVEPGPGDSREYEVDVRLFVDGVRVCERSQPSVIRRTLTPEICRFDAADGATESTRAHGHAIVPRTSGRCRIEVILPQANEGHGLETITEFDVVR